MSEPRWRVGRTLGRTLYKDGVFIGILEDIDLLSFLAGNSQLVAARIDRAVSLADLRAAAWVLEPPPEAAAQALPVAAAAGRG